MREKNSDLEDVMLEKVTNENEHKDEQTPEGDVDAEELLQQNLGDRLRRIREERGMGVRELARQIDVSASLISHIELGRGAPSVKTLYALTNALRVPMSELFVSPTNEEALSPIPAAEVTPEIEEHATRIKEAPSTGFVQRSETRKAIQLEHGFRWERLTPESEPDVEFLESIIAPGGGDADAEMKTHNGTEYGVVLEGQLGVNIGFESYILGPNDSIVFDSTNPHSMWNAGTVPVRSIWFVNRGAKR